MMQVEQQIAGRRVKGRGRGRAALLAAALALASMAACDRDREATPYGGDPEGRVVTAGATADELVSEGSTARRIASVRLSPGLVERWFTAQERLEALAASDESVRRLLDDRDRAGRGRDAIAASVRHLEGDDRVRAAIGEAGLSTEEFVLTALALHQALLATSPGAPDGLRSLAARNVRFVDEHAGLLERLAAPRPPRVLAYTDTVSFETPFIDTLGAYDDAPYDLGPYPAAGYPAPDPLAADSGYGAEPLAPLDSIALPPVIAPSLPREPVRPPPAPLPATVTPSRPPAPSSRPDTASAARRDSVPARRDSVVRPPPADPSPAPPAPVLPTPAPIPTPSIPPAAPPMR